MKLALEKQLQSERTLKTQVHHYVVLVANVNGIELVDVLFFIFLLPQLVLFLNFIGFLLKAVNKLAEIMNRKEVRGGGSRRGNDTDVRRKEKENRKLQLELRSEKEKLNSTIIKYQREINDMQAV